ncbi:MAG: hypothetical protein ABFE02_16485 [Sulfuricella sp.]
MWIEMHDTLPDHRKVYVLMEALKVDRHKAVGIVTCLGRWAVRQAGDGDITGYPPAAIANAIGWNKGNPKSLFDALVTSGFIDCHDDGTCTLHDWGDYAGRLIERRAQNAERMRMKRSRADIVQNTCGACAGATVPNHTKPNHTVPKENDGSGADAPGDKSPPTPKEPKVEKKAHGEEFGHVLLTPEEFKKMERYGVGMRDDYIEKADRYLEQIGPKKAAKYKSHYAMICNWIARDNDGVKKPAARAANGRPLSDSKEGGEDDGYPF